MAIYRYINKLQWIILYTRMISLHTTIIMMVDPSSLLSNFGTYMSYYLHSIYSIDRLHLHACAHVRWYSQKDTQYPSLWLLILQAAMSRARTLVTQTNVFDIMSSLLRYDIDWRYTNGTASSSLLSWCCDTDTEDHGPVMPFAVIEWLCAAGK
jgi:hypothetical protein